MKGYISEEVQEFGKDVSQVVTSPETRWLFTVVKVRKMQGNRLNNFHSVVMKLL